MYIERVGYFGYKLYSLGWHNALHENLDLTQHLLLNIFLYYRKGFAAGSEWSKNYAFDNQIR
jgi:hypothetical protein